MIIVPISFVSDHSETLVELDIDYKNLADQNLVAEYIRVPTLATHKNFINSLTILCLDKVVKEESGYFSKKICPNHLCKCFLVESVKN